MPTALDGRTRRSQKRLGATSNTVVQVRRRLVEEGLERALGRKKQQRLSREKSLDGEQEAQMIALSCGPPPEGRARWTLRLLSQRLVEMEIVGDDQPRNGAPGFKKTSSNRT